MQSTRKSGRRQTLFHTTVRTNLITRGFCFFPADHVAAKFSVDSSQIKTAIRTKLNNEDKLLKKRLGLGKTENRANAEQSFCQDASLLPDDGAMTSDSQL